MSFAFGEVRSLRVPQLGVEIVDLRSLSNDESSAARGMWHTEMQTLLRSDTDFPFKETCINVDACLGALNNAYVDHAEAERRADREPLTYEEFSRLNFDTYLPDFISKPHLDMHWFGIRANAQGAITGAVCISNVEVLKTNPQILTLSGWPVVVHPAIQNNAVAVVAGIVARTLMDNNLVTVDRDEPNVDFVQWDLPTHPDSRYETRGGNTYGRDVFEEMADGVKVKFADQSRGNAPSKIKRELDPSDNASEFPDYRRPTRGRG